MNAPMTFILACLGIFGFFILLFGFLLLFRYIGYREKIKLAEKGIYPQVTITKKPNKGLLIAGWVITIIGALTAIGFWLFGFFTSNSYAITFVLIPFVLLGLFPLLLGLILLLTYVIKAPAADRYQKGKTGESKISSEPAETNWNDENQKE